MANAKSMWTIFPGGNENSTECYAASLMVFSLIKRGKEKDLYRPQFPFLASISLTCKNNTGDFCYVFVMLRCILDQFSYTLNFTPIKVYQLSKVMDYGILRIRCITLLLV